MTGFIGVSVDDRLVPELCFSAIREHCCAALRWVAENVAMLSGCPNRIALTGDSDGALRWSSCVSLCVKGRAKNAARCLMVSDLDAD